MAAAGHPKLPSLYLSFFAGLLLRRYPFSHSKPDVGLCNTFIASVRQPYAAQIVDARKPVHAPSDAAGVQRESNAWNGEILAYARMTPRRDNCVMVIVNLDPHNRQECDSEVPLWEFGLPDDAAIEAEDLLHGGYFSLCGKIHRIALDPASCPVIIWRLLAPQLTRSGHDRSHR